MRRNPIFFGLLSIAVGCQLVYPLHEDDEPDGGAPDAAQLDGQNNEDGSSSDAGPLAPYVVEVMNDSPILYLRFGEDGGATAIDETGHDNGKYPSSGVTWGAVGAIAGDPNTAVTFAGTQGVIIPPSADFSGRAPCTIEFWASPSAYFDPAFVLDHGDHDADRNGWDLYMTDASLTFERWNGGTTSGSVASSATPLSLNVYHHVVATFDGAALKLYVDNQLVSNNASSTSLATTGISWTVGQQNCGCSGPGYQGALDELAIYSTALGADRVSAHYHAAIGH